MKIVIVKADIRYLEDCIQALDHSDLGSVYFNDPVKVRAMFEIAIQKREVYVALADHGKCVGFIWYMEKGVFGSYPYLHIISVKEEYRSRGIGKQLMKYYEDHASEYASTKYFLTVDDFNPRAKRLYEKLGYSCVGILPDFYKKGISCYLMLKVSPQIDGTAGKEQV